MRLVYPPNGHQTFESATFALGSVVVGETVTLNHQPVPVSEAGFFAIPISLKPGKNEIHLTSQALTGEITSEARHTVIHRYPLPFLQSEPDVSQLDHVVFPHELVFPQVDIGIHSGETLLLACPAPPGSQVTCLVDELMDTPYPLQPEPYPMDRREGIFGQLHHVICPWPEGQVYMAAIIMPTQETPLPNLTVHYHVQKGDLDLRFEALGMLTVMPSNATQYALVKIPDAVTRTEPIYGARKTPLMVNTLVSLTGFWGEACHAQYSPTQGAWIAASDLKFFEETAFSQTVSLHFVDAKTISPGIIGIDIPLQRPVPMDIVLETNKVVITFFGTVSHCDVIHYAAGVLDAGLAGITWQQPSETVMKLKIALSQPLVGLERFHQDGVLRLIVKTNTMLKHQPFVIALDAGHGGEEWGATAPDGTPEKALNLGLSQAIAKRLEKNRDVTVVLTRTQDVTTNLSTRIETAVAGGANLLISLHHNALPDGRDPMQFKGVSTYYYHPFALQWAKTLHDELVQHTQFDDYGLLYDSLFVCRTMAMPSILLELGFLTHPDDAARCLDIRHQEKVADAVASGIQSIMRKMLLCVLPLLLLGIGFASAATVAPQASMALPASKAPTPIGTSSTQMPQGLTMPQAQSGTLAPQSTSSTAASETPTAAPLQKPPTDFTTTSTGALGQSTGTLGNPPANLTPDASPNLANHQPASAAPTGSLPPGTLSPVTLKASLQKTQVLPLTLTDVLKLALGQSITITTQVETTNQSRFDLEYRLSNLLPSVSLQYTQSRFEGAQQVFGVTTALVRNTFQPEVLGSYTVYTGGANLFDIHASKQRLDAQKNLTESARQNVLNQVAIGYYELQQAYWSRAIALQAIQEAQLEVALNQARLQAGVGVKLDYLQSETNLANDKQTLLVAEDSIAKTALHLVQLLDFDTGVDIVPPAIEYQAKPLVPEEISFKQYIALAQEHNPLLHAYYQQQAAAGTDVKTQIASIFPQVNLTAYHNETGSTLNELHPAHFEGLQATTNLLQNMGVGTLIQIRNSRAAARLAQLNTRQAERTMEEDLGDSLVDLKTLEAQIDLSKEQLTYAVAAYNQAFGQLKGGVGTTVNLENTELALTQARINLATAFLNFDIAEVNFVTNLGLANVDTLTTGLATQDLTVKSKKK